MTKKNVSKSSANSSTPSKKENAMSKKNVSKSSANEAILNQILALLGEASERGETSEASAPKSEKAERTYEFPELNGSFSKELFARPLNDDAKAINAAYDSIRQCILSKCTAPIASALRAIKDFEGVKKLLEQWAIPTRALRTVLQLVSPVVCVSCDDTRTLAHMYGMDRANALMGSVCNSFMYEKIADKSQAIPFKRVCYNFTTLGLNIMQDWDNDSITECVKLCDMWLSQCTEKAPKKAEKSTPKKGSSKAEKSAPKKAEIDKNDLLAKLAQLLNN